MKRSIRERRRRERRKFGTFYLCLRGWFSRKTARTRQSFENAPESRALECVILCELPNTKKEKEEYSRAPKARAEKILVRFTYRYGTREDAHRIVRGWFKQGMYEPEECFENAAESRTCEYVICSRRPTKRKKSIRELRRRERRKFGTFYVCFTQARAFARLVLAKNSTNQAVF